MPSSTQLILETGVKNGTPVKEIYFPLEKEVILEEGIGQIIMNEIGQHSERIAQIDPATGQKETYASVLSRSIRVAQNLRAKGFNPGDIISMCTYNNLDYTPVMLASFFIGTYTAPMDPTSPLCDFVHLLKVVTPKVLFCDEDCERMMETAVQEAGIKVDIVVFGETERNIHFSEFLVEQGPESGFQLYSPKNIYETSCIHFSSGTTGLPKAVCVTHYGLAYVCHALKENKLGIPPTPTTGMIVTTPFWISNMNSLVVSICKGDTRILPKKFNETTCMKYVQDYKVTMLFITPANGIKLLENPENYNYDLSSLRVLGSGGSSTSVKQFLNYIKAFPNKMILDGYGMTETGGLMLNPYIKTEEELRRTNKVRTGTPIPGFRYKLVNPETEEICGPNEPGELRVKCAGLFKCYYKNPKAYEETFDSEGFFKTGDVLYYEDDFVFTYVTRIKDVFKYQGYHIPPVLIEEQLLKHPNIIQAAVVGVPFNEEGDHATAAVVVRDKDNFDEEELIQFANENLADKYHIRGGVYMIDIMPTTSTGKLQRRKITDFILKQKKNNL